MKNPPAFPTYHHPESQAGQGQSGMSLLDHFAGQALIGLCANTTILKDARGPHDVAKAAYSFADAMLAERAKAEERP